jgi:hypothetical protein
MELFKERRPNGQKKKKGKTRAKLLTILVHKENVNENHTNIPPHSC